MTAPTLQYPNNETAARALRRTLNTLTPPVRHLTLYATRTPWAAGRESAAFSEWRLVPANTPGVHRHGRLVLRRLAEDPNQLSAGFGVTRGMGRQLADLADPDVMMDGTWFWRNRLVGDVLAGALDAPIRTVMAETEQSVYLALSLIRFDTMPDLANALYAPSLPADRLVFRIRDDARSLSPAVLPEHELSPLASSPTLRDLLLHIEAHPDLAWAWIDLHLGAHFAYGNAETVGAWDAAALWRRTLAPWLPWVH